MRKSGRLLLGRNNYDERRTYSKGVQDCLNHGACMDCPYTNNYDCKDALVNDLIETIKCDFLLYNIPETLTAKEAALQTYTNENNVLYKNNIWFISNEIKKAVQVGARKVEIQVEDEVSERICRYFQLLQYKVDRLAWSEGVTKVRVEW